jgi:hypothetical protein
LSARRGSEEEGAGTRSLWGLGSGTMRSLVRSRAQRLRGQSVDVKGLSTGLLRDILVRSDGQLVAALVEANGVTQRVPVDERFGLPRTAVRWPR